MKLVVSFIGDADYLSDFFEDPDVITALTSMHEFNYNEKSSMYDLIYFIMNVSRYYVDYQPTDVDDFYDRFTYNFRGSSRKFPESKASLLSMINVVCPDGILYVNVEIPLAGGLGIDKKNGLDFVIYTNEKNHEHEPHIHVYKGSDRNRGIRVSLMTFQVQKGAKCNFKKSDLRKALQIIKDKHDYFLNRYFEIMDLSSFDISVDEEIVDTTCYE